MDKTPDGICTVVPQGREGSLQNDVKIISNSLNMDSYNYNRVRRISTCYEIILRSSCKPLLGLQTNLCRQFTVGDFFF